MLKDTSPGAVCLDRWALLSLLTTSERSGELPLNCQGA
jgi:hypothetical protein